MEGDNTGGVLGGWFGVFFTVGPGAPSTGYSYLDQWGGVADDNGRAGWIFVTRVGRRG